MVNPYADKMKRTKDVSYFTFSFITIFFPPVTTTSGEKDRWATAEQFYKMQGNVIESTTIQHQNKRNCNNNDNFDNNDNNRNNRYYETNYTVPDQQAQT